MNYFRFFLSGFLYILIFVLSSCGHKETLGDTATNFLKTTRSQYIDTNEDAPTSATQKRGILSWFNLFNKNGTDKKNSDVLPPQEPKITDNSIKNQAKIAEKVIIPENTGGNITASEVLEKKKKPRKVKKSDYSFFNLFKYRNSNMLSLVNYKENTISFHKGLNIAVLRIPYSDDLDFKVDELNKLSNPVEEVFQNNNIDDKMIFSDLDQMHQTNSNESSNSINNSSTVSPFVSLDPSIYKNYVFLVKYKDIMVNKDLKLDYVDNITSMHKDLIKELLALNTNYKVLYVIYRDINHNNENASIKNQLLLLQYVNKVRAFLYNNQLKNIFVQEVKLQDLPINQILLVVKPITQEQFQALPKHLNIYNAPKISSKKWISTINSMNEEVKHKQKSLYRAASGINN